MKRTFTLLAAIVIAFAPILGGSHISSAQTVVTTAPIYCVLSVGTNPDNQTTLEIKTNVPQISHDTINFNAGGVKNSGSKATSVILGMRWSQTEVFQQADSVVFKSNTLLSPGELSPFENPLVYTNLVPETTYKFQIFEQETGVACTPFYITTIPNSQNAQGEAEIIEGQAIFDGDVQAGTDEFNTNNPGTSFQGLDGQTQVGLGTGGLGTIDVVDPNDGRGLVPCGQGTSAMCGWDDLMTLVWRVIDFSLILLIPATAAVAVAAGINMIVSRGKPGGLEKAKKMLLRVVQALALVLVAWAVIAAVYQAFIPADNLTNYVLLDIFKQT
jgi:hypothetical protein